MSGRAAREEGPSPLDWIESAARLLRSAPVGALLCYYFGSITALLGFLFFWADMSQGAFAAAHLGEAALSTGLLYIWMKCWQTVFLSKLRAHLLLEPEEPWTPGRIARLVWIQAALQPTGLFLRLFAAQILVPYIWVYSFYLAAAIRGDGTEPSLRAVVRASWREAGGWWRQTHLALVGLLGFALFIWLNVVVLAALLPYALRTFFGIQTPFTRDLWAMFNTTFFAATFAMAYLCFDPLRKAVFLIRHFHGASFHSGKDLRVALKAIRRSALAAAALFLLAAPLAPLRAAEPPAPARVDAVSLDHSLDRVLERREYAWRLPRAASVAPAQKGVIASFFESVGKTIIRWLKNISRFLERIGDWIRRFFARDRRDKPENSLDVNWSSVARGTLVLLAVALLAVWGVLWWRWRHGRRGETVNATPFSAMPDLNLESVTADQLPEDGWLRLARELMEKGELRLALRAFYLAGLAHLGQRELIKIARYKSNRDYDRELRRRARGNADLLTAFDANLLTFEAAWYGEHSVTSDTLGGFSQNLETIRAC